MHTMLAIARALRKRSPADADESIFRRPDQPAVAPLLMLEPWLGLRPTLWTLLAARAGWFAVALFDPRRRTLHDILAATEVRLPD